MCLCALHSSMHSLLPVGIQCSPFAMLTEKFSKLVNPSLNSRFTKQNNTKPNVTNSSTVYALFSDSVYKCWCVNAFAVSVAIAFHIQFLVDVTH